MKRLIKRIILWAIEDYAERPQPSDIEPDFNRVNELELRFRALEDHLGISIRKPLNRYEVVERPKVLGGIATHNPKAYESLKMPS